MLHTESKHANNYTRFSYPVVSEKLQTDVKIKSDTGRSVFVKYCESCHQVDGSGVPGMYPPIEQSDWVNGDKQKLIKLLLKGKSGEIEVNGEVYDQSMPTFEYLSDRQISAVLTYIRQNFGNKGSNVDLKEVKDERSKR